MRLPPRYSDSRFRSALALTILAAVVVFIYGSHLKNSFQFDDFHTIVQNPYLRDIHNVPRFFVDSGISSVLPANRVYRPVLFTSLAVDYRLGHGLAPLWFHLSTLIWFVAQIALIFVLSRSIFDSISPEPDNRTPALLAAAVYGLHPVMAETVNYVIQRADLQSTLGVLPLSLAGRHRNSEQAAGAGVPRAAVPLYLADRGCAAGARSGPHGASD